LAATSKRDELLYKYVLFYGNAFRVRINVLWNCSSDLASSSLFLIPSDLGSTLPQSLRCNATMLHYQVAYLQASATPGDGEDGNCP